MDCMMCERAEELIDEANQNVENAVENGIEIRRLRSWDRSLTDSEIEALQHYEQQDH